MHMGVLRVIVTVVLGISLAACHQRKPASPVRKLGSPRAQFGTSQPIQVLEVDPHARWAVLCQADDRAGLDGARPRLFYGANEVTIDGVVAFDGARVVAVVDGELVLFDADAGSRRDLGAPQPAALVGDRLIVGGDGAVVVHDLAAGREREVAIGDGRVAYMWVYAGRVFFAVTRGRPAEQSAASRGCMLEYYRRASLDEEPGWSTLMLGPDAASVIPAEEDPRRFWTPSGVLEVADDESIRRDGKLVVPARCAHDVHAVLADPLRVLARCEDDGFELFGPEGFHIVLTFASDGPDPDTPFATTEEVSRVHCDPECFDMVTGKWADFYSPVWQGPHLALVRGGDLQRTMEDRKKAELLFAIDLEAGTETLVERARPPKFVEEKSETTIVFGLNETWTSDGHFEDSVTAEASHVVGLHGQVIDVAAGRVVSQGPWEIHAVTDDGFALVTTDGHGPLRRVAPGTME